MKLGKLKEPSFTSVLRLFLAEHELCPYDYYKHSGVRVGVNAEKECKDNAAFV
jgi:hypothetical protein